MIRENTGRRVRSEKILVLFVQVNRKKVPGVDDTVVWSGNCERLNLVLQKAKHLDVGQILPVCRIYIVGVGDVALYNRDCNRKESQDIKESQACQGPEGLREPAHGLQTGGPVDLLKLW